MQCIQDETHERIVITKNLVTYRCDTGRQAKVISDYYTGTKYTGDRYA
jgi:hypothetical protein